METVTNSTAQEEPRYIRLVWGVVLGLFIGIVINIIQIIVMSNIEPEYDYQLDLEQNVVIFTREDGSMAIVDADKVEEFLAKDNL